MASLGLSLETRSQDSTQNTLEETAIDEDRVPKGDASIPEHKANQALEKERDTDVPDYEVRFDADDPDNPKNWSLAYRWYLTMVAGLLVMNATFASAAPTGVVPNLIEYFKFSKEVATATISLFVAGYCVGPLVWGPLSEQIGRRPIFILTFIVYTGFQVGCALSRNVASILIFRFLGGVFAAAPLSNSGALMSDIWDAGRRGKALALFTLAPFAGPAIGPLVSGFMGVSGVSWRWVFWVLTIFAGTCLAIIVLTLPETYAPVILVRKARRRRKETRDDHYWAPLEKRDMPLFQRVNSIVARPFIMLACEPMLLAVTVYMSFVYGCIYLLFVAYPIVFTIGHHMSEGITGLMYLPILIGGCLGVLLYLLIFNPRYEREMARYAPHPAPPEARLEICKYAAPIFALSFFWFAWTSYPTVSYWATLFAGLPLTCATVWVFLGLNNYTIDAYLFFAASALSCVTIVRSLFGAAFPLFAAQMYAALNPRWASTLLGCLALLMCPIPFVLSHYGPKLRMRSHFAPTLPAPSLSPVVIREDERV
ncbi:MFS general substrate transporter [Sparassis latifolia]